MHPSHFATRFPASIIICLCLAAAARGRETLAFDDGWRFRRGENPGAEQPAHPATDWTPVTLPHDWSIAGPFAQEATTGAAGGFLPAGIGWYRKRFALEKGARGQNVAVEFDGVMAHSDVWINGFHLGTRPNGTVSFAYDLTEHLNFAPGGENVLAVKADNSGQPASRWYPGAGIYRHVRLVITHPVHLEKDSVFITTPAVDAEHAVIKITGRVLNATATPAKIKVRATVRGASALSPLLTVGPASGAEFALSVTLARPDRWQPGHPALADAEVSVETDRNQALDRQSVPFGIREFHFDAATGFWINGQNLKLKGVCLHDDVSALGSAAPLDAWRRRLTVLHELGVNAIRTAHNPPDPGFLGLCDQMGFLVMDEFFDVWTVGKEPFDYHLAFRQWSERDERDSIRRDRNHPSIVLWSVGNEIHDTPQAALAYGILQGLVKTAHDTDPTRPVTQALFRPNVSHDYDNGLADLLDVVGTNYRYKELLAAHEAKPSRKIIGTENRHDREEWLAVRDNACYAGEFVWAGIDYLGEAGRWPSVSASSGLLDRTGVPRAVGYEFASWWSGQPMIKTYRRERQPPRARQVDPGYGPIPERYPHVLFDDWTPASLEGHPETVEVYSNAEEVELTLNGARIGDVQSRADDLSARVWIVPFTPGTLVAIARNGGREVGRDVLRTAGPPAQVRLIAESPALQLGWEHVAYVEARVVDASGVLVPSASVPVRFAVTGPATLIGVDSANNRSHESFQGDTRESCQGRCWAIVRGISHGPVTIEATSAGLGSGSARIAVQPAVR
jgi:beta-galactosidase